MEERQQEIRKIWKDYASFYRISGALFFVLIGVGIGWVLFSQSDKQLDYLINLYSGGIQIVFTVLVLDWWTRRRDERQNTEREKQRLIRQMGSRSNAVAVNAAEELQAHRWSRDGSLQGANLEGANLRGINLYAAYLREAFLAEANLEEANLDEVDMQDASLYSANMKRAYLEEANLQGAQLWGANLEQAYISGTDFKGANLVDANLQNAAGTAWYYEDTTLPDGTNWSQETDMERFTNPDHPYFWRSDEPSSPAYRGKTQSVEG